MLKFDGNLIDRPDVWLATAQDHGLVLAGALVIVWALYVATSRNGRY